MRSLLLGLALCVGMAANVSGQLTKDRLFKVDPASGIFKEMRVTVENRIQKSDLFWFISPNFHHQQAFKRGFPEKYFGPGVRGGLRYYLLGPGSPAGLYFQGHLGYHLDWLRFYNDELKVVERDHLHRPGLGAALGYQWLYGAKNNIAFGFLLGAEYYLWLPKRDDNQDPDSYLRNWYDILDFGGSRLRPYIGVEIGFAFRQRNLHW